MQDAFPGIDSFVELPEEHSEPFGAEIDRFIDADGAVVHFPIGADQSVFRKEFFIQIRSGGGGQDVKAGQRNARLPDEIVSGFDALLCVAICADDHLTAHHDTGFGDGRNPFFVIIDIEPAFIELIQTGLGSAFDPEAHDLGSGSFHQRQKLRLVPDL